jgi:magnesium transporter
MIQYFKNIDSQTVEIEKPENGIWVNLVPPFKEEEFLELADELEIPIEFLRDSLDIDERPRFEIEDNVNSWLLKHQPRTTLLMTRMLYTLPSPFVLFLHTTI